jgi:SAM-dependent methyltransferase
MQREQPQPPGDPATGGPTPGDLGPGDPARSESAWTWDPSLYAGSAGYYAVGRAPYPQQLADVLADRLRLDSSGRLVDVGCGPGSLTLLLAPHFAEVVGVDADAEMLAVAGRLAGERGLGNVHWRQLRGEDLPADLPPADVVIFAQSFHWMDRPRVAAAVRRMLAPGGALVHVSAMTHQGVDTDAALPYARVPYEAVNQLVQRYLGPVRRAGQGVLTLGLPGGEDAIYRAAGFTGPERLELPQRLVDRTAEQVAASVFSLSSSAPHLFGDRLDAFDAELRELLAQASPDGRFSEQLEKITADIWR